MSKNEEDVKSMNIHQKLLKIANMAGVLQKNKSGYNYKYTTEDEIQAKITAGMQKYHVMLMPSIREGTLKVQPYTYQKQKGKDLITINEIIVNCEVVYTWTNCDTPTEKVECNWAYIGQMEDASQAFGAGATYGNRYYLIKALQLATTDDDPDNYRSKQAQAENFEEEQLLKAEKKKLKELIKEISDMGTELINTGKSHKEKIVEIVSEFNYGNGNPNSIKSIDVANTIKEKLTELQKGDK